jgi:hypothetical protein
VKGRWEGVRSFTADAEDESIMSDFELETDADGRLVFIDADGHRHAGVVPVRCFPLTDPERWLALCDRHGKELVLITNPAELPTETAAVLGDYRRRHEFFPQIERIEQITVRPDAVEWRVTTDRGAHSFQIRSDDDVRRLSPQTVLVIDAAGTHYRIADVAKLDAASRKLLDRYL